MAMYTLKGIGEISTDAFDEKITLENLLASIKNINAEDAKKLLKILF